MPTDADQRRAAIEREVEAWFGGFRSHHDCDCDSRDIRLVDALATLVEQMVGEEQEACATIAATVLFPFPGSEGTFVDYKVLLRNERGKEIAAAIRARTTAGGG